VKVEHYTGTSLELAKLKVIDTSADVLFSLISRSTIAIVFVIFLLLPNFGLSFWLGELLGTFYFGFFIMSAAYLILSMVLYSYKNHWIKIPVSNFIITKMLKNN
jgi:hypothetical protein